METYDFPDHIKNDTFNGIIFTVNVNGSPLDLTSASIKASFKRNFDPTITLVTPTGLTITDASGGEFKIEPFIVDWPSGTYSYDIAITLITGVIKTYIKGTWDIVEDL